MKEPGVLRVENSLGSSAVLLWPKRAEGAIMEPFGSDRFLPCSRDDEYNDSDEYDLVVLNFYIFLKAERPENAALKQRILAHWETFQRHRDFGGRDLHVKEKSYCSID
ncbi:MAG: hypothetical protein ACRYFS_15150 [Janthinobacterium lividum]